MYEVNMKFITDVRLKIRVYVYINNIWQIKLSIHHQLTVANKVHIQGSTY